MLKRLVLIGLGLLCLITLSVTDVAARCRVIGGTLKCGSLCAYQFMKAVKPDTTAACISLLVEEADAYCQNPGEHCPEPPDGTAVPFKPDIILSDASVVTSGYVDGQGKATFEAECWDLLDEFQNYFINNPVCKDNWEVCNVVARKVLMYFSGWNWDKNAGDYREGDWVLASEQCIRFISVPNPDSECGYDYIPVTNPNDEDYAELGECENYSLSGTCDEDIDDLDPPSE